MGLGQKAFTCLLALGVLFAGCSSVRLDGTPMNLCEALVDGKERIRDSRTESREIRRFLDELDDQTPIIYFAGTPQKVRTFAEILDDVARLSENDPGLDDLAEQIRVSVVDYDIPRDFALFPHHLSESTLAESSEFLEFDLLIYAECGVSLFYSRSALLSIE